MSNKEERVFPDESGKCPVGYHKMPADENHETEWCMEGEEHPEGDSTYSMNRSGNTETETRMCNDLHFAETRNEDGTTTSPRIVGYPVVFNSLSNDLGGFVEKVQRGAFAQSLNDNDEVHALFNHDSDKVLGRRGSGTLKLWEDDYGLRMELDPPNTTLGNDVVELLKRGDLVSMSFGFYDVDDSWEVRDGANVRTINSARLFDVSIVVNPAYSSASVQLAQRSLEKFQAEKEVEQTNFDSVGKRIDLNLRLRLAEQE